VSEPAAAIVCTGDTLSHLASREEARALVADAGLEIAFTDVDKGLVTVAARRPCRDGCNGPAIGRT
jgi:hypothetical protein